jgi:hypothetical protein
MQTTKLEEAFDIHSLETIDVFPRRLRIIVQKHLDAEQTYRANLSRRVQHCMRKGPNSLGFAQEVRTQMQTSRETKRQLDDGFDVAAFELIIAIRCV